MVVLIPSYKRIDILPFVIRSVLDCKTSGIDERILILIANNYYPNKLIVDSVVANINFQKNFEYKVIHREKTIPMMENWFSAIFSVAEKNEVICLLGDDDIMLPWGLVNRYNQIRQSQADMLLSDFYDRIYFFEEGKKCWLDGEIPTPPARDTSVVPWEYLPAKHPEASFMSNHCYRNTEAFRRGFEKAMTWCDAQDWVPVESSTANCPFYMGYAIKSSGGKVVALHEKNVMRGCVADEVMYQEYADGGNTSFFCLLIYDTFSNKALHDDLKDFQSLRNTYKRTFLSSFISIIGNKLIPFALCMETMRHSGINFRELLDRKYLSNIHYMLQMIPGIRGFRLQKRGKSDITENTRKFLKIISNIQIKAK